jgi:hypothetical protein
MRLHGSLPRGKGSSSHGKSYLNTKSPFNLLEINFELSRSAAIKTKLGIPIVSSTACAASANQDRPDASIPNTITPTSSTLVPAGMSLYVSSNLTFSRLN